MKAKCPPKEASVTQRGKWSTRREGTRYLRVLTGECSDPDNNWAPRNQDGVQRTRMVDVCTERTNLCQQPSRGGLGRHGGTNCPWTGLLAIRGEPLFPVPAMRLRHRCRQMVPQGPAPRREDGKSPSLCLQASISAARSLLNGTGTVDADRVPPGRVLSTWTRRIGIAQQPQSWKPTGKNCGDKLRLKRDHPGRLEVEDWKWVIVKVPSNPNHSMVP